MTLYDYSRTDIYHVQVLFSFFFFFGFAFSTCVGRIQSQ